MIDIEIMQDASEIIHYDSNKLPYAIQERLLSQFTGHKALCHWHPDIECIRIYEGSMNYEINGEQILLRAGDIIIVNSGQLHYGYANGEEDCKFCVELLHPNIFKSNLHIYQESVYPIVHSSSISYWLFHWSDADYQQIVSLVDQIFAARMQHEDSVLCLLNGLFHCLWHCIYQHSTQELQTAGLQKNPDISLQKQMVTYIHEHYAEDIGLDDIASAGNISRSKCCKIFQAYLQQSPVSFLNDYRMEISCNLLSNTSYSITEIALACGFNHLSYFSKSFLKKYGCTPNQYRQKRSRHTEKVVCRPFCSNTLQLKDKENKHIDNKYRDQTTDRPSHISKERRHFNIIFLSNRAHHKVWRITNIRIGAHEYCTTGNRHQEYLRYLSDCR